MDCQHCGNYMGGFTFDKGGVDSLGNDNNIPTRCRIDGREFYGSIFARQCGFCGEHNQILVQVDAVNLLRAGVLVG